MRRALAVALLCALAACGSEPRSDWERLNADRLEAAVEKPVPAPSFDRSRLVEVQPIAWREATLRHYIDPGTLALGDDGTVRYVLVSRSDTGAESVTFEAIRCRAGEFRIYAVGRADGSWSERPAAWRRIPGDARTAQNVLFRDYLCPDRRPVRTREEGERALRAGGHPLTFERAKPIGGTGR